MLVVDLHTLQTIYILNLVHNVFLHGSGALIAKMSAGVMAPSDNGVPAQV